MGHVRDRQGVPKKEVSTERYKGFRIYESADGWTVPELDRGSLFESKREVKRFIDFEVKNMARNPRRRNNRGESTTSYTVHSSAGQKTFGYLKSARVFAQAEANRLGTSVGIDQNRHDGKRAKHWEVRPKGGRAVNPRTMQTYYFYENGTRLIAQYRSGSKAIALKYFAKSFPFVYRRGNFTVTTTNGRAVNPSTLVPAKLQRMPNGTIKVLVSPGAMAKMRVGNPTRYGDLYTVYRKEGRYSWEQTGHNFSSKSDANGQITIWKRGDRRDPPPYPKYKIVKLVKEYSRVGNPGNSTYAIYESSKQLGGHDWFQTGEQTAKSGAAAIRQHRASQRARGNEPFRGTKFKAVKQTVKEYSR